MPDPKELVVSLLSDELTIPVSTEVPAERPAELVTVETDDQSDGYVIASRCYLTCWGKSDRDAHGIAMACVDILWDAAMEHPLLSSAQLESVARDRWARTGQARYEVVLDLTINTNE